MSFKILAAIKKCLMLVNKLVIRKMKGETGGVELAEFLGLKKKMHLLSVDDNSQHKTTKGENRSVAAKISHIEYKCIVE